jgi:hypothetical protein
MSITRNSASSGEPAILRCSFCNKNQNEVSRLIAGPTVFICDECVEVCKDIVSGKYDTPSASDEIAPIAWLNPRMRKCPTCGTLRLSDESLR